jgi:hypothetical protein
MSLVLNFLWDILDNSGNSIFSKDLSYTYFRINAYLHTVRGGRSANKLRKKSQICELTKYVRLADLPQMEQFVDPIFFCNLQICDLRTQFYANFRKYMFFFLQNINSNGSNSNLYFITTTKFCRTNLRPNFLWFCYERVKKRLNCLKAVFHPLCHKKVLL